MLAIVTMQLSAAALNTPRHQNTYVRINSAFKMATSVMEIPLLCLTWY